MLLSFSVLLDILVRLTGLNSIENLQLTFHGSQKAFADLYSLGNFNFINLENFAANPLFLARGDLGIFCTEHAQKIQNISSVHNKFQAAVFILNSMNEFETGWDIMFHKNVTDSLSLVSSTYFYILQTKTFYELFSLNGKTTFLEILKPENILSSVIKRRSDFEGMIMPIVSPFSESSEDEIKLKKIDNRVELESGLGVEILRVFMDFFNFSVTVKVSNNWPSIAKNGSWTGMGYYLSSGEVEIAAVRCSYLPYRAEGFDILVPHLNERMMAYFRQPLPSSVDILFTTPFSIGIWMSIAAIVIGLLASAKLFCKAHTSWGYGHYCKMEFTFLDFSDTLSNHSSALRMLLVAWLFLSITMDSAYNAALTSVLTSVYAPIKTMDDLNKSKELSIIGQTGSGLVTSIFGDRIAYMEPMEATRLLLENNYAYVGYPNSLKEAIFDITDLKVQRKCFDIHLVRVSRSVAYGGFLTRKNSPYTTFFQSKLIAMEQYGLLDRLRKKFTSGRTKSPCIALAKTSYERVLGLMDLAVVYAIVTCGMVLASCILAMEMILYRRLKIGFYGYVN